MNSQILRCASPALVGIAAALMSLSACAPRALEVAPVSTETESSWETLFDGATLDLWRGFQKDHIPSGWSVKDAVIYCAGTNGGDLITKGQWQNFDLELEWKISEAGNSGIMYRVVEVHGAPYLTGPEMQVLDDDAHPDAANDASHLSGAAYDLYAPAEDATKPAGEWNSSRILVDGTHVEHWLNGVKVVEYELFSEEWNQRVENSKWAKEPDYGRMAMGHIALQDHGDEVWYRNVRIKRLPDTQ
ncbi:MAG: DUF1080 domain-containing protein [Rhodothermales bacterium]|nr:DUF1080 domain-containing protein [Rhodothermales bacterium]